MIFTFDSDVAIESVNMHTGYHGSYDTDFILYALDGTSGPLDNPMNTTTYDITGWTKTDQSPWDGSTSGSGIISREVSGLNAGAVASTVWMLASVSQDSGANIWDSFKLIGLGGTTPDDPGRSVPAPSSLILLISGLWLVRRRLA